MNIRVFLCVILWVGILAVQRAGAAVEFGGEIANHVLHETNVYDTDTQLDFNKDELENIIVLSPYLGWSQGRFSAYSLAQLTWTHSFETSDDDLDPDLANAFVRYTAKPLDVYAGLQPFSVGRGFIHRDNEPGMTLDVNFNNRSFISLKGAAVGGKSGLFSVNFGYRPSLFEKIEVFGAYYKDNDDSVATLLGGVIRGLLLEYPVTRSTGDLVYVGAGADLFIFDIYTRITAIHETGNVTFSIDAPKLSGERDFSSSFVDVDMSRNLTQTLTLAGFFTYRTGGSDASTKTSYAYVTPMPMMYRQLVFDSDQFGPYENSKGYYSSGIVVPGLVAPGLRIEWCPADNLLFKALAVWLYPQEPPDDTRTRYGWEWDLSMKWSFMKHWSVNAQTGVFTHGDFFRNAQGETPEPATKTVVGLTFTY